MNVHQVPNNPVINIFCSNSLPLASTRWVRLTLSSLCPSATSNYFFPDSTKNFRKSGDSNQGPLGAKQERYALCNAAPIIKFLKGLYFQINENPSKKPWLCFCCFCCKPDTKIVYRFSLLQKLFLLVFFCKTVDRFINALNREKGFFPPEGKI